MATRVILQENVEHLGRTGDIVRVKDGYARNFLVPRGLAVVADGRNVRRLNHQKRLAESRKVKALAGANALAEQLSTAAVTITKEAGEDNKIFGSVTNRDIAEALAADGFEVDRKVIHIDEPIRTLGVKQVKIKLHADVETTLTVYVTKR
ncbi:MAG: 50S ribosomal protein L9 [Deltaproteobacteria bacterium]|nr:50S ribosomal protein L9 [Deltaproteobacteria bacterium]HCH62012.1 50S ribosomal protein L9 [Deltaproteobacteria bacterium]